MRARARTRTHRIRRKKVDCLSAAGYDNRWTVMRINSRRVEKSWIGRFFSARYTPRFANKQTVSTRRLSPLPPPPLSIPPLDYIRVEKKRGSKKRGGEGREHRTNPFPPDRPIHFFHLSHSQEFFNIRYTSLGMLPRIDIPFRRGGIERPWRRCTDHLYSGEQGGKGREERGKER